MSKQKTIAIRVNDFTYDTVTKMSYNEDVSISELCRELIVRGLAEVLDEQ